VINQKELLKEAGYSDKAIKYFLNREGVGTIKNADSSARYKGPCGDIMEFFLKIEENIIKDVKFQAIGCAGAYSSGSALTKMIKNKPLIEAEKITERDIFNHLGKIPDSKIHCARLALITLKKAIEDYEKKK
jgi:nitrogen fixation protein NifU and related proteins